MLSFNRRCEKKSKPYIKLVVQVEHGKVWLPRGMQVSNHPKVVISQPFDSLPPHLQSVLTDTSNSRRVAEKSRRSSVDFTNSNDKKRGASDSLFKSDNEF